MDDSFDYMEKCIIFVRYNLHENFITMIIARSTELRNNMKKYPNSTTSETISVQRNKTGTFAPHKQVCLSEDFQKTLHHK
jgi:hypothetical protein